MKTIIYIITLIALCFLSACTQFKSYFPDKEREYQYTAELPPLIYPADLKVKIMPALPAAMTHAEPESTAPVSTTTGITKPTAVASDNKLVASVDKVYNDSEVELDAKLITIERINVDKNVNALRLNVPFYRAWRIVSKSLSRKALEVMVRDQEAGLLTLKYDPDEHSSTELSYMDSLKALIGTLRSNEKTYIIKLEKDQPQTDITVLDKDQKPATDTDSVNLLTMMQETMKVDLAIHK
jgi:outer membrane protein assembly factor BamC